MSSKKLYFSISLFLVPVLLLLFSFLEGPLFAFPPVKRMVLPNRLVLLLAEEHSLPFVTLQLLIESGASKDPLGKEGLAYLTGRGLLWGTSQHTAAAINERLDFMGADLSCSASRDFAVLNLRVLKKELDGGLDLFLESLMEPSFPQEEMDREVKKTLASILASEDNPEDVAEKEFEKVLFMNGSYGQPVKGTKESLPRISREEVIQFFRNYYHPNDSILTITGDITLKEVQEKILPRLTGWLQAEIPSGSPRIILAEGPEKIEIDRPITQANIILGHGGVTRDNPDFYALTVMNYILGGGGFSSRLMKEIRNKRGLAYSLASFFSAGKLSGSFQIILQTKNASAAEAIKLSREQMERIRQEPVSVNELEGAKKYLIGSFPMRFDTQGKLVNFLGQIEFYGLGLEYPNHYPDLIRSISQQDVLRVAQKYLHPQKLILVMVANLQEAQTQ